MQSRRQFLSEGLRASAAVTLTPFGPLIAHRPSRVALSKLHHRSFSPHLQTLFRVWNGKLSVPMLLVNVTADNATTGECFSLRFRGRAKQALAQGTYRFEHKNIGVFDLFIVPGEANNNAQHYSAIINRV
jgi:hypothetical protein